MWKLVRSQVSVEGWVLHMDEHGLLDGPGMAVDFLCTMLNCSGSMGCPVVVLCKWMGEGALKCSLTLCPRDLPDSPKPV